jgi:hypothetical protein
MLREEDEDIDARGIETQTHSRSSRRRRKPLSNHSNHREVDEAAEDAAGEVTVMLLHLRSPMLPLSSSYPRRYRKRRIEAVGVDVVGDEVDEEEAVQSASHSVWLLEVANSVDN